MVGDTVGDVVATLAVDDGVAVALDNAEVVGATLDASGGIGVVQIDVADGGAGWLTVSVDVRDIMLVPIELITPPGPLQTWPFGQQPYCPLSPRLQYSVGGHPREPSGQHM